MGKICLQDGGMEPKQHKTSNDRWNGAEGGGRGIGLECLDLPVYTNY